MPFFVCPFSQDLKRKVEIMAVTRDTERKTAKSRVREVNNKIQGLTMTLDRTRAKLKVRWRSLRGVSRRNACACTEATALADTPPPGRPF